MSQKVDKITAALDASARALKELGQYAETIAAIADKVAETLKNGGTLFLCGNGGSAAQCQHIAAEFTGRFRIERRGLPAVSLTTDTSALTAIGNDYGFDQVFARQLESLGKSGDLLIGISTSGNSKNVILAFEKAAELGIAVVALTGPAPCKMADGADICLAAPGEVASAVQECHIAALHSICEVAELDLTGQEAS